MLIKIKAIAIPIKKPDIKSSTLLPPNIVDKKLKAIPMTTRIVLE